MLGIMTTVAEQLGAALRTVREAADVSQGQLAARIGKKQSMISEYESGRKPLPLRDLADIEKALGVTHGAVLVAAGFVDQDLSARDLIMADPSLSAEDRRTLVKVYDLARRDGGSGSVGFVEPD